MKPKEPTTDVGWLNLAEREAALRDRPGEYVYFMRINGDGPIKIGRSRNPNQRLFALATACPYDIEILGVFGPDGLLMGELELHAKFERHRIFREWFRPDAEILDFVACHAKPWPWKLEHYTNRGRVCMRLVSTEVFVKSRGRNRGVRYRLVEVSGWKGRHEMPVAVDAPEA